MYCTNCGATLQTSAKFCNSCGSPVEVENNSPSTANSKSLRAKIGYSPKINDPAFARYQRDTSRYSWIFSGILAIAAVGGFFIYGATSSEMDNPQALLIGLVIGGMFLFISLLTNRSRKRSTTWDGQVVDKKVQKKRKKKHLGGNDYVWAEYYEYTVHIQKDTGKIHTITVEDDDTIYNYYNIGDKVRHHGGLNTIEKYDKSKDAIIFCSACATLCDIEEDYCPRCKCPLLK